MTITMLDIYTKTRAKYSIFIPCRSTSLKPNAFPISRNRMHASSYLLPEEGAVILWNPTDASGSFNTQHTFPLNYLAVPPTKQDSINCRVNWCINW